MSEDQYDDLLKFEKSPRFSEREKVALTYTSAIVWNADRYGPIGVVFVLMSWLTWFSTVLLGGAVFFVALLMSIIPSLWAARLNPVEALSVEG